MRLPVHGFKVTKRAPSNGLVHWRGPSRVSSVYSTQHLFPDAVAELNLLSTPSLRQIVSSWEREQKGLALKEALVPSPSSGKATASVRSQFQQFCGGAGSSLFLRPFGASLLVSRLR